MATYEKVSWLEKFKSTMKKLTWKERIEYLWEYYKWVAIAAVAVIAATVSIIITISQNSKDLVYAGVTVNMSVSEEAKTYLTDDLFAKLEGNAKKERIDLTEMYMNMGAGATTDTEMVTGEKLMALVTGGDLDYLILDASSLSYCGANGIFAPLENSLSKETIAKFEEKIVMLETGEGSYRAAIDISDLPFIQKNIGSQDKVYIAFPGNTSRSDRNEAFLQYLMDWTE